VFDLTDVTFIKRIMVGSSDPEAIRDQTQIGAAMDLVNRCLSDSPKGKIIGMEKTFSLLNIGEHQVVLQCMIYHIGFTRKPSWLDTA
jgi:hypothetical protein